MSVKRVRVHMAIESSENSNDWVPTGHALDFTTMPMNSEQAGITWYEHLGAFFCPCDEAGQNKIAEWGRAKFKTVE